MAVVAQFTLLDGGTSNLFQYWRTSPNLFEWLFQDITAFQPRSARHPHTRIDLSIGKHGEAFPAAGTQISFASMLAAHSQPQTGFIVDGYANLFRNLSHLAHDLCDSRRRDQQFGFVVERSSPFLHPQDMVLLDAQ